MAVELKVVGAGNAKDGVYAVISQGCQNRVTGVAARLGGACALGRVRQEGAFRQQLSALAYVLGA